MLADGTPIQRKRGVRASRPRLEKAMAAAGFTTQAALAEAIADAEQQAGVPKDLVNKVFRQKAVSHANLERIASALGVEAFSLYLTADEQPAEISATAGISTTAAASPFVVPDAAFVSATDSAPAAVKNNKRFYRYLQRFWHLLSLLLLLLSLLWFWWYRQLAAEPVSLRQLFPQSTAPLGRYSLMLAAEKHWHGQLSTLSSALKPLVNLLPQPMPLGKSQAQYRQWLEDKQADFVLVLYAKPQGRFMQVIGEVTDGHQHYRIYQHSMVQSEWAAQQVQIQQQLAQQLAALLSSKPATVIPLPAQQALQYYTEGMALLDQSEQPSQVLAAQSRFQTAIKRHPSLALAHAGLCQAYLHESWHDDEKYRLNDAMQACNTARELSDAPVVLAADAFLKRRTGQATAAISSLQQAIRQHPTSGVLRLELANAFLERFQQQSDAADLLAGAQQSEQAVLLAPHNWKPLLTAGTIAWFAGDVAKAVRLTTQASQLDDNDLVIANLGTFSFCQGHTELAQQQYQKALQRSPDSYLAHEMLSMVAYFAGNHQEALMHRQRSIDLLGNSQIHQMYGALADIYLELGRYPDANIAFAKALQLTDRDAARGNLATADAVYAQYYRLMQALLSQQSLTPEQLAPQLNQWSTAALAPAAHARLALIYLLIDNPNQAQQQMQLASQRCEIYRQLPGWQARRTGALLRDSLKQL